MEKNGINHRQDSPESLSAESRLIDFLGFGGADQQSENPDADQIGRKMEKQEIVMQTKSAFLINAMHKWESKTGANSADQKETDYWKSAKTELGMIGMDPFPREAYIQLADEDEWFSVFQELGYSRTPNNHVVDKFWNSLTLREKHELFKSYMTENFRGADLSAKFTAIENLGLDARADGQYEPYRYLLGLREYQTNGHVSSGIADNERANAAALVVSSLRERYISGDSLKEPAYSDLFFIIDRDQEVKGKVLGLDRNTVSAIELSNLLPPCSLKVALKLGSVFDDAHAREIVAKCQDREKEFAEKKAIAHEEQIKLKKKITAPTVISEAERLEHSGMPSDVIRREFSKLSQGQKLLVGVTAVAVGIHFIRSLSGSKGWNKIGNLVAIGTGITLLGGDKMIKGILWDSWGWGSKGNKKEQEEQIEREARIKEEEKQREFIDSMGQYVMEHGEEKDVSKMLALGVMGMVPIKLLAANFTPSEDGRGGELNVTGELREYLREELKKYQDVTPRVADAIIDNMGGDKWGNPLAHIFYEFGIHAQSDELKTNQKLHAEKILPALRGMKVDKDDPLSSVSNFDKIDDSQLRDHYIKIMNSGKIAAIGSDMTLSKFIVSITPKFQQIEAELEMARAAQSVPPGPSLAPPPAPSLGHAIVAIPERYRSIVSSNPNGPSPLSNHYYEMAGQAVPAGFMLVPAASLPPNYHIEQPAQPPVAFRAITIPEGFKLFKIPDGFTLAPDGRGNKPNDYRGTLPDGFSAYKIPPPQPDYAAVALL